jgi:ubiquitin carboxyl-terminal hydrolase L3
MSEEKKVKWIPLESNPDTFNKYVESLGVKGVECVELYGFDEDLLAFVPRPHLALIFCFPDFSKAVALMKPLYDEIPEDKKVVPDWMFFMKQKISNACGTFSLYHAIANNLDKLEIGSGPFSEWFNQAKELDVQARSDHLANYQPLAGIHKTCAESGETAAPAENEKIEHHFVAYTNIDGRLIELDSAQDFPRDCGPTSEPTLLKDAAAICMDMMVKLDSLSCNAIVLVKKQ